MYLLLTGLLSYALNRGWGTVPAAGSFFSPYTGFWQTAEPYNYQDSSSVPAKYLNGKLKVITDSNLVYHVFADSSRDLYFSQGYLTARHRLWQMEFQTFAAAGRLSELVGEKALEYDRFRRRFGMLWAAENSLAEALKDPESALALNAYSDGVNAYINDLTAKELPLEYKLLGYSPEPWSPLKTSLLLKYMSFDLTGWSDDRYLTNTVNKFGPDAINKLFPAYLPGTETIMPRGTPWPAPSAFENSEVTYEKTGRSVKGLSMKSGIFNNVTKGTFSSKILASRPVLPRVSSIVPAARPNPANGSNNWAVSGKYTRSGTPILCNDPHLGLNLPSLWYQIQLSGPGYNCAGVSLPGAPGIIIGFNDSITWGVTNTGADVLDFFKVQIRSAAAKEYLSDEKGTWAAFALRTEAIKVRGRATVYDTIRFTPDGPVAYLPNEKPFNPDVPVSAAVRWRGHDASNELQTFLSLNKARNYKGFTEALKGYNSPAQNFAYSDAAGNIALWCNGNFPLRRPGEGRYLLASEAPQGKWKDRVPQLENPHIVNPARGFVSSANQSPSDSLYPYYLSGNFAPDTRARRINNRLRAFTAQGAVITPDSMRLLQTDAMSLHAMDALGILLPYLDIHELNQKERTVLSNLQHWDGIYTAKTTAGTFFDIWWDQFTKALWQPNFGSGDVNFPSRDVTLRLLATDSALAYYGEPSEKSPGKLRKIIRSSFKRAVQELPKPTDPQGSNLRWGNRKATGLRHLTRLESLSRLKLYCGGERTTVNALSSDHGPSWRMVVQTGKVPQAFGIYPGGQQGNPGSRFYDNFVPDWQQGKLRPILLLKPPVH